MKKYTIRECKREYPDGSGTAVYWEVGIDYGVKIHWCSDNKVHDTKQDAKNWIEANPLSEDT